MQDCKQVTVFFLKQHTKQRRHCFYNKWKAFLCYLLQLSCHQHHHHHHQYNYSSNHCHSHPQFMSVQHFSLHISITKKVTQNCKRILISIQCQSLQLCNNKHTVIPTIRKTPSSNLPQDQSKGVNVCHLKCSKVPSIQGIV